VASRIAASLASFSLTVAHAWAAQRARVRRLMADSRIHQAMSVTMAPAPPPAAQQTPRMMRAAMPRNDLAVWVAAASWA